MLLCGTAFGLFIARPANGLPKERPDPFLRPRGADRQVDLIRQGRLDQTRTCIQDLPDNPDILIRFSLLRFFSL